jgi:hypothetical protein
MATGVRYRTRIGGSELKGVVSSVSEDESRGDEVKGNQLTLKLRKLFSILPSFDIRRSSFAVVGAPN